MWPSTKGLTSDVSAVLATLRATFACASATNTTAAEGGGEAVTRDRSASSASGTGCQFSEVQGYLENKAFQRVCDRLEVQAFTAEHLMRTLLRYALRYYDQGTVGFGGG